MSVTTLAEVQEQVQKYWSPKFTKQLRASHLLANFVNKEYEGEIKEGGDTVYVTQINAPTGELKTIGAGHGTFSPEAVSTTRIAIAADKRAIASYEFDSLVQLQSQIDGNKCMDSLMYAMRNQINNYLYSLVSPSSGSPDHLISGVTDLNAAQLIALRVLAGQALWPKDGSWFGLIDPVYHGDLLGAQTMTSGDYVGDRPVVGGVIGEKRFGFSIYEDDSRGPDFGLFAHPDFMHMVEQTSVQVKISDLHANKQFGYLMSVDLIFGAKLGIDGDKKHIKVYNS